MFEGIVTFFTTIGNAIGQITNAFTEIFRVIEITIEFIPMPFRAISLVFFPIIVASIIYKAVRG